MLVLLEPYRVLDLTDERGELAGFMLAQLGAEVIAIEPPNGSPSRSMGPFRGGKPGIENSLRFSSYGRGKSSVILDLIGSESDRQKLLELAKGADVLIDSAAAGKLAELGLSYNDVAQVNPALIYVSITPFGLSGPKADWAATDLTVWAAAGPAGITGDSDRAPLRLQSEQASMHASAEAAGAIIAALYERSRSGLGQLVDVSAQQASAQATQSMILAHPNGDTMLTREAGGLKFGDVFIQLLWPCMDGHVSVTFLFGSAIGVATDRLMQVLLEEGFCDQATRDRDWIGYGELLLTGREPIQEYDRIKACVGAFCMAHTKAELLLLATEQRLLIAPVNMIDDVVGLDQFRVREFWDDLDGDLFPGPFAKATASPLRRLPPAPTLGADTSRVLSEPRRKVQVPETQPAAPHNRPLEGVKVLDFMWVMAGPAGTRVLADLGATVVRVESNARIDTARTLQPFKDNVNSLETSLMFANMNAGKLGATINPTTAEGLAVIKDLIQWADIITESYSPKAMVGFGLDYESVREINPSIIMMSSCLFGQTGPLAEFAGYGTMAAAMSGFFGITGWPDRAPSGPFGAYTDYISPRFAHAALLAALDYRRRTGRGQYVDFAQAEAALHAVAPLILDYTINGNVTTPIGNDDARYHPHGTFPCAGDDRWIALACTNDEQRSALESITGGLDNDIISQWTSEQDLADAETQLQSVGIPSHRVADSPSMAADPQLIDREHFVSVPHAALGEVVVEGPKYLLSRTPAHAGSPPTLGQHTAHVLTDILGYNDERMVQLLISGGLE